VIERHMLEMRETYPAQHKMNETPHNLFTSNASRALSESQFFGISMTYDGWRVKACEGFSVKGSV
jgi:hypothetical protein